MKAQLDQAIAWYEGLITRERWLILASAVVLVALIMDLLIITPTGSAIKQKQAALINAEETLKTTRMQLNALQGVETEGQLANKNTEQNALQQQVSTLQGAFSELSKGLIAVDSLPVVLEEILLQAGNLKLQEMIVEPPVSEIGGLYKHMVSVKLTGGFFDVVNYLKALEKLEWNFYWEALHYNVQSYPDAEVELKVYTLSTEEIAL